MPSTLLRTKLDYVLRAHYDDYSSGSFLGRAEQEDVKRYARMKAMEAKIKEDAAYDTLYEKFSSNRKKKKKKCRTPAHPALRTRIPRAFLPPLAPTQMTRRKRKRRKRNARKTKARRKKESYGNSSGR